MKKLNQSMLVALVLSLSPLANGAIMSNQEITTIRNTLKSLGYQEESLTNEDLQTLRMKASESSLFADSVLRYKTKINTFASNLSCGVGTHGCKS